ncbi:transcription factor MYB62 [Punica granatum]|uniref:Uncharacterized protein n=2 Tax=Punica granatum TaxID=22663 RepID=A0A218W6S3_PUNGR|nr:transcription factor MYB62 [Punica granatum]OWM68000.1 hypothetical protein CDL15_Pgr017568 [Punica granatum]PKI58182.1 hypothetical protein CRG98_021426 [Punica granatum]
MRGSVSPPNREEESDLRRGPWTREEDNLLLHYIARHGEGRWNLLAKCAGLKRTGKSCRLRWLNYLKPDVKRGNLSPQEQLLILELHYKWGNRWSKIAQHLPGRTDNEIKNYWRTRVQKQARQLNVESSSKRFLDVVRLFWMPALLQKTNSHDSTTSSIPSSITSPSTSSISPPSQDLINQEQLPNGYNSYEISSSSQSQLILSPDLGKPSEQREIAEAPIRADDNVEGLISSYDQSFDGNYFNNMGSPSYNIDGMDAMPALGVHDCTPSFLCHVDENDIVGHVVEDSFWTTGGLW